MIGLGAVAVAAGGSIWWLRDFAQGISAAPTTLPDTPTPAIAATPTLTYKGHAYVVMGVAWSPDGKRIASADANGVVQVWDTVDGGHVLKYQGHTSFVYGVAWSPDGKHIASADDTVQVWDAVDGEGSIIYSDTQGPVAWSPDGKQIVFVSTDHTVQIWEAP